MNQKIQIKDRVKYIGNESNNIYYPPKFTRGTVVSIDSEEGLIEVQWDSGVKDGIWSVKIEDVEPEDKVCYYCSKFPEPLVQKKDIRIRITKNKLEIRKGDSVHFLEINYCVFCGRKMR